MNSAPSLSSSAQEELDQILDHFPDYTASIERVAAANAIALNLVLDVVGDRSLSTFCRTADEGLRVSDLPVDVCEAIQEARQRLRDQLESGEFALEQVALRFRTITPHQFNDLQRGAIPAPADFLGELERAISDPEIPLDLARDALREGNLKDVAFWTRSASEQVREEEVLDSVREIGDAIEVADFQRAASLLQTAYEKVDWQDLRAAFIQVAQLILDHESVLPPAAKPYLSVFIRIAASGKSKT